MFNKLVASYEGELEFAQLLLMLKTNSPHAARCV
jgi:hypothetical protein